MVEGLRVQKKARTRREIAEAAFELFAADGFDQVSVAAVARRAQVSEATVFNYFRTKEDLVFDPLDAYESGLVEAVRDRPAGTSVAVALGAYLARRSGLLGSDDPAARARLVAANRMVASSPHLLARERQIYEEHARALADALAREVGTDPHDIRPMVVATALIGVQRALVDFVRGQVMSGRAGPELARRVARQTERALALLDAGLANYPGPAAG